MSQPRIRITSIGGSGDGQKGDPGDSAYQVALNNGFVGTEQQWLDSLVGADGLNGADGTDGAKGDQGDPGPAGANGLDGADGANGLDGADALWNYLGEYNNGLIYTTGDVVTYNGQLWYRNVYTSSGYVPGGEEGYWDLLAAKGIDGADGADGAQGPQGEKGDKGDTGDSGATVGIYGSFYDNDTQTVTQGSESIGIPVLFRQNADYNGVSIVDSSKITVSKSGTYDVQFSFQFHNTGGGGNGTIVEIWLRKNGVDVPETNTRVTVNTNSPYVVAAWDFLLNLDTDDNVQLIWTTDNHNIVMEHTASTTDGPYIPSAIVSVIPVMATAAGTGTGDVNLLSVESNILPSIDNYYTLGSANFRWKDVQIGPGTIYIEDQTTGDQAGMTVDNGTLLLDGIGSVGVGPVRLTTTGITFADDTVQTTAAAGIPGPQGETGPAGADGDRYTTTSTNTLTIANSGTINLTVGTGLAYTPAQTVIVAYDTVNHMHGTITSYNETTGALVLVMKGKDGSGTYSSWTVNLDGAAGSPGPTGATGATGPGVAAGGTAGQYLTKVDGTDYNTQWSTLNLNTKQDVVLGVSSTEIGYLDGVTSSIQTQINEKAALLSPTITMASFASASSVTDPVTISTANNHGGSGYAGIMTLENTGAGVTNPKKFIRLNNAGAFEIVNDAYSSTLLNLSDNGNLSITGTYNGSSIGDSGWQSVSSFSNGFTAPTAVAYRKINNVVYMRGALNNGTGNTVAFTLPSGYRPSVDVVIPVQQYGTSNTSYVTVNTNGNVTPNASAGWLSSIVFAVG